MTWIAINCPQCSAPLPRQAIWRTVQCTYCGVVVTKAESVVARDTFRQAFVRAHQSSNSTGQRVQCAGHSYSLLYVLGSSELSKVYAGLRMGPQPLLATIKLSRAPCAAAQYAQEAQVLRDLQALQGLGAAYYTQRLPELLSQGLVEGHQDAQHALIVRSATGYACSLAVANSRFARGIDPRHAVWMWRRMLEVLGFLHSQGWCHGDVRPEHALVHPQNHGVRLIGWASARANSSRHDTAQDVQHSARVIRVLLIGALEAASVPSSVPAPLAQLVMQASDDIDFCKKQGAQGIDVLLKAAAVQAYGPPQFVPFVI